MAESRGASDDRKDSVADLATPKIEGGMRSNSISIFSPDGTHLANITTGQPTTNMAWGEDGRTLFVTGGSSVYRIRVATKGARY